MLFADKFQNQMLWAAIEDKRFENEVCVKCKVVGSFMSEVLPTTLYQYCYLIHIVRVCSLILSTSSSYMSVAHWYGQPMAKMILFGIDKIFVAWCVCAVIVHLHTMFKIIQHLNKNIRAIEELDNCFVLALIIKFTVPNLYSVKICEWFSTP